MTHKSQDHETDEEIGDEIFKNLPSAISSPGAPITRTELLDVNNAVINLLVNRLRGKRFRPQAGDTVRLGYIRALIGALQVCNEILKTSEIDEIEKKIDFIERRQL